jgi:AcrR family transcriptional regulator
MARRPQGTSKAARASAPPRITASRAQAGPGRAKLMLDALQDVILKEGFANLTVGDLAARLRCSRRTLYELAPSKHDLVLLILRRFFKQVREEAYGAVNEKDDPGRQIFEYMHVGVDAAMRMSPVAVADIDRWAPANRLWQEHISLRVKGLRELVQKGIDAGLFRGVQVHLVAEVMFASWLRIREADFYVHQNISLADAFRELTRLLLHGLLHRGADDKPRGARGPRRAVGDRAPI